MSTLLWEVTSHRNAITELESPNNLCEYDTLIGRGQSTLIFYGATYSRETVLVNGSRFRRPPSKKKAARTLYRVQAACRGVNRFGVANRSKIPAAGRPLFGEGPNGQTGA